MTHRWIWELHFSHHFPSLSLHEMGPSELPRGCLTGNHLHWSLRIRARVSLQQILFSFSKLGFQPLCARPKLCSRHNSRCLQKSFLIIFIRSFRLVYIVITCLIIIIIICRKIIASPKTGKRAGPTPISIKALTILTYNAVRCRPNITSTSVP